MTAAELTALLAIVDPHKQPGKVTLITRYGEQQIDALLPAHIQAVGASGHRPVWQCDPMHGNTRSTPAGVKTRAFAAILAELASALRIHRRLGSCLGGVHLELTGDAVTECVGGSEGLRDEDLGANYTTSCDPRLNERQALELAFLVAGHYRDEAAGERHSADGPGRGEQFLGGFFKESPERPRWRFRSSSEVTGGGDVK
jgi:3-deoxy-7-phosphoheptulonate synthase